MFNNDYYSSFMKLLNKYEVRYMIVGGFAVNVHGYSRFTADLDIWSDAAPDNRNKLIEAIEEFGFDASALQGQDLTYQSPVKLPEGQLKIEILHSLQGCTFSDAYTKSIEVNWGKDTKVRVISYDDLIANKSNSMRMKDAVDVEYLNRAKSLKEKEDNS